MLFKTPIMVDQTTGKASVTLTFCYLMFYPALASNVMMLYSPTVEHISSWGTAQISFFAAFIMYRMRKIDKVKATINGNSVELSGGQPPEKTE